MSDAFDCLNTLYYSWLDEAKPNGTHTNKSLVKTNLSVFLIVKWLLLTLSCSDLNKESVFVGIENISQKHIKVCLAEKKLGSLKEIDFKYRMKNESIHGIIRDDEWESIFMIRDFHDSNIMSSR